MTLGMKEMLQIAQMFTSNINFSTFYGIAGLGDLIATCSSNLSRNFTLGSRIARGEKLKDIVDIGTVEGVKTTSTIYNIAVQQKKEFPITFAVYKILSEEESPESFKKILINLI